jgi:hypothetical protein
MSGPTELLGRLRRRRATLGRSVLVLFALASFSAGAAPCFAMAASTAPVVQHHVSHQGGAPSHAHSPAASHEHGAPLDRGGEPVPSPCPHCPLTAAPSSNAASAHSFCSAGDDVADSGKSVTTLPSFKHVLLAAVVELLPVDREPRFSPPRRPPTEVAAPSVALNLRHCVFLI